MVVKVEKESNASLLTHHYNNLGTCGGVSDECFVFLLLSTPLLAHEIPFGKTGKWSTLYELGYMGSFFFIQIYAGAALGGVITGVQLLQLLWTGWTGYDDRMQRMLASRTAFRGLDSAVCQGHNPLYHIMSFALRGNIKLVQTKQSDCL